MKTACGVCRRGLVRRALVSGAVPEVGFTAAAFRHSVLLGMMFEEGGDHVARADRVFATLRDGTITRVPLLRVRLALVDGGVLGVTPVLGVPDVTGSAVLSGDTVGGSSASCTG